MTVYFLCAWCLYFTRTNNGTKWFHRLWLHSIRKYLLFCILTERANPYIAITFHCDDYALVKEQKTLDQSNCILKCALWTICSAESDHPKDLWNPLSLHCSPDCEQSPRDSSNTHYSVCMWKIIWMQSNHIWYGLIQSLYSLSGLNKTLTHGGLPSLLSIYYAHREGWKYRYVAL